MNHEDKSREELFTEPGEVVAYAQAYYATEFPNNERCGCPTIEALRQAARAGAPPGGQLRSHLFSCSECFRSYRSARLGWHAQAEFAGRRWYRPGATLVSLRWPWAPVAAGVFGLILLCSVTAALLLWYPPRHSRPNPSAVAVNYSPEGVSPATAPKVADPEVTRSVPEPALNLQRRSLPASKASQGASKTAAKNTRPQPFLRVVYVDLKEDDLLRGDDEAGQGRRVITLSRERQRLRLRMPRGSAAGRYTVRVVDAYGKPLLTTAARSGGRTLTVELDLRGLAAKVYRLCLARAGEAPDCFVLSLGGSPPAL